MSKLNPNTPVLVGIGVISQRQEDPAAAKEAIALMIDATRAAAADTGAPDLLKQLEYVYVPQGRWQYKNPAGLVARAVGASNATTVLAKIGILQQTLMGDACHRIAKGEIAAAAVVGGEAGYRILRSNVTGTKVGETADDSEPHETLRPHDRMQNAAEIRAGLSGAIDSYAIIESAYRAAHGWSVEEHRDRLASLYATFSNIAGENPNAWKREPVDAKTIRNPSPKNPMLAFPYTKLHSSSWNVDQAAALLFCSAAKAEALGIPECKWLLPLASTESNYMMDVSERPLVAGVPGAEVAGKVALEAAGVTASELDFIELYSCFPVAVEVYAEAIGISLARTDLTVTGGMTFAGGPLNNYVLQSTCRTGQLLRARPGSTGLVTSVSGLLTKQGFGVWTSALDASRRFQFVDVSDQTKAQVKTKKVLDNYDGPGVIAGYTVLHAGSERQRAVAIIDIDRDRRTVAYSVDGTVMAEMESAIESVGRGVSVGGAQFDLR